jgi:hypothetical protein
MAGAIVVSAAGCGDSPSLSQAAFARQLAAICTTAQTDLAALAAPRDRAGTATFAADAAAVLDTASGAFAAIRPPKQAARDFVDFQAIIDDQRAALTELGIAADGADDAAVQRAFATLSMLNDEQNAMAGHLGVAACGDTQGGDSAADPTIPSASPPIATAPPPVDTKPDAPASAIETIDLAERFEPPAGYTLEAGVPDEATIQVLVDDPLLSDTVTSIGVATLIDSATGVEVADLWIGLTATESTTMPTAWIEIDCGSDGAAVTSPGGIDGVSCTGPPDTSFSSIFSATVDGVGISVYMLAGDVDGAALADAFFLANA